jgi:hypothetical protein
LDPRGSTHAPWSRVKGLGLLIRARYLFMCSGLFCSGFGFICLWFDPRGSRRAPWSRGTRSSSRRAAPRAGPLRLRIRTNWITDYFNSKLRSQPTNREQGERVAHPEEQRLGEESLRLRIWDYLVGDIVGTRSSQLLTYLVG